MNDISPASTLSCASSALMKTGHQWLVSRGLVEGSELLNLARSVRSWSISLNALFWPMQVYYADTLC